MRESFCHRMLTQIQHEIGPIHAPNAGETLQLTHPDHRHAIGCDEKGAIKDIAQSRIVLRFADAVDSGDGDVAALPLADRVEKKLTGTILIENADADTQHVHFFNLHEWGFYHRPA